MVGAFTTPSRTVWTGTSQSHFCPITPKSVNLKESALIKSVFLKHLDELKHAILLLAYSREEESCSPRGEVIEVRVAFFARWLSEKIRVADWGALSHLHEGPQARRGGHLHPDVSLNLSVGALRCREAH